MLAHEVEATVPELTPWVRPMLRTMGWLSWTTDGKRQERRLDRGFIQSGPLSNLLYPISMALQVKMVEAVARLEIRATIACYQDDVNVVATPRAESLARSRFIDEMGHLRQSHPDRQLRQESRALILRHGAPCPVPAQ